MIDDDDSKIRRNLIAYCFLILLSYFFKFSLIGLFSKIIGQELYGIDGKFSFALLSVLLYLLLRFLLSDFFESSILVMKGGNKLFREKCLKFIVKLALFSGFARKNDLLIDNNSLRRFISLYIVDNFPANSLCKIQFNLDSFILTEDYKGFYTVICASKDSSGNESVSSSNEKIYFSCANFGKNFCLVVGGLKYLLFSKFSIELFFPLYLSLLSIYSILR